MFDVSNIIGIAVFIVMLFISVSFHEMMHAFTAYRLGDDLAKAHGRISLNPMHHIDPFLTIIFPSTILLLNVLLNASLPLILAAKPVPINTNRISGDELGLAAVGLAGPATNLALATLVAIPFNLIDGVGVMKDLMSLFIQLNVALFVFNMLPIPPLDGSRLLYAFAPESIQRVMEQIEAMGIMFLIVILIFLSPVIGPIIIDANQFILDLLIR